MIPLFAWRNIWRNKPRSLIIILSVTTGIFAGVFLMAFFNGMVNSRVEAVVMTEMSHIQIHQPGFLDNDQFSLRLTNCHSLIGELTNQSHVVAVSKRIVANAMIASSENSFGVTIKGVDPKTETEVTDLHSKIIEGSYLAEELHNPVIISDRLASKLKVRLHQKIVLTLQDDQNNIVAGAFKIAGLFQTDNQMFDEGVVFVNNRDITRLTDIEKQEAHEIAIVIDHNKNTQTTVDGLRALFPHLDIKTWLELSPEAGALVGMMNQYTYIFTLIILLALCFGIVNTMLMVVLERTRELGMLLAIGMNRTRVFLMIMTETFFLAITGGVPGILLGWVATGYFRDKGIDLYFWKDAFGDIGFSSIIYPVVEIHTIVFTALMVMVTGVMAALYPAYRAMQLKPSKALQTN